LVQLLVGGPAQCLQRQCQYRRGNLGHPDVDDLRTVLVGVLRELADMHGARDKPERSAQITDG
jgi:hypothetical protein